MSPLYETILLLSLVAALIVLGLLSTVFGARNLMRAQKSPHWMWLSLLYWPLPAFIIHGISVIVLRKHMAKQKLWMTAKANKDRRIAAQQYSVSQRALAGSWRLCSSRHRR